MTNYRATHAHVEDQSTAMFVGFEDDCQTIVLKNEDGVVWADSAHKWNRIPGRLHAHVATFARDCDGGHGYDYITEMNEEEIQESQQDENDFSDIHFKQRVLGNHVFFSSEFGVTVKIDEDGFDMHERTDEGYRAAEVRWCTDDCVAGSATVYDEYAEAMGY